mmetsp:Transcript_19303/g.3140  ORF Transcript_19303/g.3140 Transcript_19303/m.3140 type:complete len:91 (+) Transcript_19303:1531-1803(+)
MSVFLVVIIVRPVVELQVYVLAVMMVGFYKRISVCNVILCVKLARLKQIDVLHAMIDTFLKVMHVFYAMILVKSVMEGLIFALSVSQVKL